MAWYKSDEWRFAIEAFDDWFYEATQYVNDEGDRKIRGLYNLTEAAIDAVIDVAHLAPMPVWDVYRFISDRDQHDLRVRKGYPIDQFSIVSIQEIYDRLRQVQMYRDRMCRVGICSEKPGPEAVEVVTVSANDARDEWMYSQKLAGQTHGQIRDDLENQHADWGQLADEQTIGRTIDRYCDRNGLPRLRKKTS